ncbi:DEAD/DEAH box helicase family protein [Niallia nealsonii]|uniref:DEAD/DEAH box helicase family protein n=1 Tax=Niallia nealsonii TaxID=115979 RepID=UPI0014462914|nr:DEAD/DEAH box helicase family protein [Niallia nealsonii]
MEHIEEVILEMKNEINQRKNKKLNIKLRTFLGKLGYKRRNSLLIDKINQCLEKNSLAVLVRRQDTDWSQLDIDERITFEIWEGEGKEMKGLVESKYAGTIRVSEERNPIELYLHQTEALQEMDKAILNDNIPRFSGLLVIPTGGGKTLTAVQWVLRNVINNDKKVLWVAHRHELLEQALSAVKRNAYANLVNKRKEFKYRIISGQHDRPVNIKKDDDFIIASKDSLNRGIDHLANSWLNFNDDIFLVVDEAHHATAKTYRKIIDLLNEKTKTLGILGLTATPFRTAKAEKGLLKKTFDNDIVYKVDLKTLISRGILSEPIFKELKTEIDMTKELSEQDIKSIQAFDSIPEDIAKHIAENKIRNNRIVQEYIDNKEEYGKLLVFAVNKIHAIELNKLFNDKGIASEYVISSEQHMATGIDLSNEANRERIRKFRNNEIDVLINVNILTEGTDLPDVQTVFLTRPTISSILMTQMIGRALRGKKAGGTDKAYIVSFIDGWKNKIAWINPEKLYIEETAIWEDNTKENVKKLARLISIQKIEEFVKIIDDSIDTTKLESIDFIKTIPLGIYTFSLMIPSEYDEDRIKNCEVLVYDSTLKAYQRFIEELPVFFKVNNLNNIEFIQEEELDVLAEKVEDMYFTGFDMIPSYNKEDIKDVLRYFALKGVEPSFLQFKDREKFDISIVAQYIYENELGGKRKKEYLDEVWEQRDNFLKVYFGYSKLYFRKCLDNEILKLEEPEIYATSSKETIVTPEMININKLTLYEIQKKNPQYWREITEAVYGKAQDEKGCYICATSGYKNKSRLYFQIDHIVPMAKGGLTELDNLQVLRRDINKLKSDK